MPINVKVDDDSPSTKKRRWASPLCKHYNIKESKHFSDGKDRAYCKYCNGGPIDEEWYRIKDICDLLQPFDEITTIIYGTMYLTANLYLKNVWKIEFLLLSWTSSEDIVFKDYWDNYSMILSFAAILDPRYKFQFVMYCFRTLDSETSDLKSKIIKDQLYKLFGEYVKEPQANESGARKERMT